ENELLDDLSADLDARERIAAEPPRLDLTLTPIGLLDRVPLFAGLDQKRRRRLARAMKTRFTIPGETVLPIGHRGAEIFFVASGALERRDADGEVTEALGSGSVFGQLALADPFQRRTTEVVSRGYCRLLELRRKDLARLGRLDPAIRALIEDAARIGRGGAPSPPDPSDQPFQAKRG
ncbi:MAG: cyclic nucleotide-binding domain-containing protein, partial [Pseudomonadota bacterium]